jgi:hypothetical protein
MRRFLALAAAASLLLALTATPAAATTTRHEIACQENLVETLVAPREWVDGGGIYHMRGLVNLYQEVGGPACDGENVATINLNLDTATGKGTVWAKGHITLAGGGGGYDGTLVASFTPDGPYIWEGSVVMQGWGSEKGWQRRLAIVEPDHLTTLYEGIAFRAGD